MSFSDLGAIARDLPAAWKSTVLANIGMANIKILRMDEMPAAEEVHDYDELLLVVGGRLMLEVSGEPIMVDAGQMYLARAGVAHAVLPGSHGSLLIIDV